MVTVAAQDQIELYAEEVHRILSVIGYTEALITDLTQLKDFSSTQRQDEQILELLWSHLELNAQMSDYVCELAKELNQR